MANLWGKVSKKTLLAQIPFVDDVDEELKAVEKETAENIKQQQQLFGNHPNDPPEDSPDEPEDPDQKKDKTKDKSDEDLMDE